MNKSVDSIKKNNDFTKGCGYIDGKYIPIDEARIPILDWGFIRSDATYDVVSCWKGKFFRLDSHVDRFYKSMAQLKLKLPISRDKLVNILANCTTKAGLEDAYVEMICTRGQPTWGSRDPRDCKNSFYAFAVPYVWIATPEQQEKGLHLHISDKQRISPESVNPTIKNYHWLDLDTALIEALDLGLDSVILTDSKGNVCEGPGFNIFLVQDNQLKTPKYGVLEGITRLTTIEIASELNINVQETLISRDMIKTASEVFISTTAGGIIPITRIDEANVGNGKPGPITKLIKENYWKWHRGNDYSTPVLGLTNCL